MQECIGNTLTVLLLWSFVIKLHAIRGKHLWMSWQNIHVIHENKSFRILIYCTLLQMSVSRHAPFVDLDLLCGSGALFKWSDMSDLFRTISEMSCLASHSAHWLSLLLHVGSVLVVSCVTNMFWTFLHQTKDTLSRFTSLTWNRHQSWLEGLVSLWLQNAALMMNERVLLPGKRTVQAVWTIHVVWGNPGCMGQSMLSGAVQALGCPVQPSWYGTLQAVWDNPGPNWNLAVVSVNGCPAGMEVKSGRLKLQCNLDRAGFVQCCREHLSGWPCKSALISRWKSKVSYFVYIYLFP